MKRITAIAIMLVCSSCLAKKLTAPVEDHHVQTQAIAARCSDDCDPQELREDLEAMATQACLIDAIVKGEDGSSCEGSE